jgi:hypothetical protein
MAPRQGRERQGAKAGQRNAPVEGRVPSQGREPRQCMAIRQGKARQVA